MAEISNLCDNVHVPEITHQVSLSRQTETHTQHTKTCAANILVNSENKQ